MAKKEITGAFDALKRIDDLERENKKLKSRVKQLRFDLLDKEEKRWVKNVFKMQNPDYEELPFDDSRWNMFKCDYMDYKDSIPLSADDLPF